MFIAKALEEPDKKESVESVFTVFGRFFRDPDFPDRIRIFWPIRIRNREKSLIRIRTKGPGSETLFFSFLLSICYFSCYIYSVVLQVVARDRLKFTSLTPDRHVSKNICKKICTNISLKHQQIY